VGQICCRPLFSSLRYHLGPNLYPFSSLDPIKSDCLQKYSQAMENYNIGRFVPQCKPDGRYEEVQCGAAWDYCWCVDSSGTELPGTKTKGWPKCGKIHMKNTLQ